jgi:hypothetical protein
MCFLSIDPIGSIDYVRVKKEIAIEPKVSETHFGQTDHMEIG